MDAAKRPAQFFDLPLIGELLAVGDFDEFKHFIQLVNQPFECIRNVRGVLDGLADGGGFGRTKIGGFDPRLWARRFSAARFRRPWTLGHFARAQRLFARTFGSLGAFSFRSERVFGGVIRFNSFRQIGRIHFCGMRSEFRRLFRVRSAKAAFIFRLGFLMRRVIDRLVMGGLGFTSGGGRRNFIGRLRFFTSGARPGSAATATATSTTAVDRAAGGGGRVQI